MDGSQSIQEKETHAHLLYDKWVLWAHLPHDTDWSIGSYKFIMTIDTVEKMITLYNVLPEKMVKNCMLFLMREGITPTWEDPKNRSGGCFSYKISNKNVASTWKQVSYCLVGETLSSDKKILESINGITISPKKSFCIMKIWISNQKNQDPRKIRTIAALSSHGCLFRGHKPEY